MRILAAGFWILLFTSGTFAAEPQIISIHRPGKNVQLVGKLHQPLGKVITISGIVVGSPGKGYEGGLNLRVQKIGDTLTQESIRITLRLFFRSRNDPIKTTGETPAEIEYGKTYELKGYATGEYVGIPDQIMSKLITQETAIIPQTTNHYFFEYFCVFEAKEIGTIEFSPEQFVGREALLQGKAVSENGNAYLQGKNWSVLVRNKSPWPETIEGKQIESYGLYQPIPDTKMFELVKGTWRLVRLEDQVDQDVELRGIAISHNRQWWFRYRGIDLYVEDMAKLPKWEVNNHFRPMVIRGRLEKALMPDLDDLSKTKEYLIVRKAKWKPLKALLSPEHPFPVQPAKDDSD